VTGNRLDGWRSEEYGRSHGGIPLRVFLPLSERVVGLLTAGIHGEEADTALLARRLLERIPADQSRWAIVQCVNPDGLLNGTRQNAAGVDLNRNFPSATWRPDPSYTFPPGIDPELRVAENRTNLSSPGETGGSEPETQALMRLVERLSPRVVVDLHTPLELLLLRGDIPDGIADVLASAAGLPIRTELESECPGAFDDWLLERGIPAVVYELEHAGLPALCKRHASGLERVLRDGGVSLR
jgi:protein MpaA